MGLKKTEGDKALRKGRKKLKATTQALTELVVEYVPVNSIKPNTYNPNRQTPENFDLLIRSIEEDGFTQPIVTHRTSNMIVDGEHRWRAARQMGMTEVPVVFVDMSDEQMRVSTLRHNRARGSEDVEHGAQVLKDLRVLGALDWAQDSLMLSDDDMSLLLDDVPVAGARASEDYTEAWETQPRILVEDGEDGDQHKGECSMTPAAREKSSAIQTAILNADTAQERAALAKSLRREVFRVNLQFSDKDAVLVRQELGENAATKLYELCKARLEGTE